jgi:hypothetical protein
VDLIEDQKPRAGREPLTNYGFAVLGRIPAQLAMVNPPKNP